MRKNNVLVSYYKNLLQGLYLTANSFDVQKKYCLTSFEQIGYDIYENFENIDLCLTDLEQAGKITKKISTSIIQLLDNWDNHWDMIDFSTQAVRVDPFWEKQRVLALAILKEMNEPLKNPEKFEYNRKV